jgi:hypothetical protein
MQVSLTFFGMILVDCWKVYSSLSFSKDVNGEIIARETPKTFYGQLAEELINNSKNYVVYRERLSDLEVENPNELLHLLPVSGIGAHLSPIRQKQKTKDGSTSNFCKQG